MARKPSWILKAPRVVLVLLFPIISFILYLILSLGCVNNGLSTVSPIVITSNGTLNVGGVQSRIDIRIGFWGICFGPPPYSCASSLTIIPTKSPSDLMRVISARKGGSNPQLLTLALALQGTLIVLSGIVLLIMLGISLLGNAVEIYFNVNGDKEEHVKASVWARALDWAAAAGSIVAFSTYRSLIDNTQNLLQVATGTSLIIRGGNVASGMFGAVVGLTAAGALINTVLTSGDAGRYAARAMQMDEDDDNITSLEVGDSRMGNKFKDDMQRRRAAYEAFP